MKTRIAPWFFLPLLWGCDLPLEAPRVTLPVELGADTVATPFITDQGYTVTLVRTQIVASNVTFTIADETHSATLMHLMSHALIPSAHAHPGHGEGGEITGELLGTRVLDWFVPERPLGDATLIAGTYKSANFTFARASANTIGTNDALTGHTAVVSGIATRGASSVAFTFVIDSPEGRELTGIPFDATLEESAGGSLKLALEPIDPFEGDTILDGVDFEAVDADGDGFVLIQPDDPETEDAYNIFRRTLQTHDHYILRHQE